MWAPAFHDHALRKVEDLLQAARYIVMNPARAGLSRRIDDYPCWNCVWLYEQRQSRACAGQRVPTAMTRD